MRYTKPVVMARDEVKKNNRALAQNTQVPVVRTQTHVHQRIRLSRHVDQ